VHCEQLVHGVELEPDPLAAVADRAFEPSPEARRAVDDAAHREPERSRRVVEHEHTESGTGGAEPQHLERHAGAVLVGRHVEEAGVAQRTREGRIGAPFQHAADAVERGARQRPEHARHARSTAARG